jgi:P4 family phage/plasmid primase-like protien
MDPGLKKILKANYNDAVFHTHVSLISPKGKFIFDRQTLEEFWDIYCKYIHESKEPLVGIAEKPQNYLPVLVDVDLKVKDDLLDDRETLYDDEQLKFIIQTYQTVLRQIVEGCTEQELICVVLEKDMYQQKRNDSVYFKHGFHLHFPYIFLNKVDQEIQLIPRVKNELKDKRIFYYLGIEDSGSVIDKACCTVPWLLYGSRKSEEHKPYTVTRIYNSHLEEVSLERAFKNYQIFDRKEQLISISNVQLYLPRILSILPYGRQTKELKRGILSPLKEIARKERKSSAVNNYRLLSVEENLALARKLLPLLADFRVIDNNEWMTIGWILYNISDGHPDGLDLWCEFSSRCEEKYDENTCIYKWERMNKRDIGIATLRHYAKIDNPQEYRKITQEQSNKYVIESLEGSHNDVSKALFAEYGDEFVCAGIKNKDWYQFQGHKWEPVEEGVALSEKISGSFVNKYRDACKKLIDDLTECEDKSKHSLITNKIKIIQNMIKNLKTSGYKNSVMRECAEVFYNPYFSQKLDKNPFLIGFQNGVYDIQNNVFRKGRPEDYLSKTMPINYREYSEDDEKVHDVMTFLEQVFPDKSVRKYFLDASSDIFQGGNIEKTVYFWTGEGDNGKSVTQKFFDLMLGKYCVKLNTNIITGNKPSTGAANAEMARCGGGVRLAVMEEPNNDEMINVGIFKSLSGNDTFFARDLFEKGKSTSEIIPLFKLVFVTNKLPQFKNADKAVFNRTKVIPFESTFCKPDDPAPETYEEQMRTKRFPMDKSFGAKIPGLVEPFAWILLEHRKKILGQPRFEPEKVRIATELYKKKNDLYRQFIDEMIVEDSNKHIRLDELYNIYKDWHRNSLPGMGVPIKHEIEEYFVKVWGKMSSGKKWKGYRQRVDKDDAKGKEGEELVDYDILDNNMEGLPPM